MHNGHLHTEIPSLHAVTRVRKQLVTNCQCHDDLGVLGVHAALLPGGLWTLLPLSSEGNIPGYGFVVLPGMF